MRLFVPYASRCLSAYYTIVQQTSLVSSHFHPIRCFATKAKLIQKFPSVMLWWLTGDWRLLIGCELRKLFPSRESSCTADIANTHNARTATCCSYCPWWDEKKIDRRCMGYCAEKYEELESLAWWCAFCHYANVLKTRLAADRSLNMQIGQKNLTFNS